MLELQSDIVGNIEALKNPYSGLPTVKTSPWMGKNNSTCECISLLRKWGSFKAASSESPPVRCFTVAFVVNASFGVTGVHWNWSGFRCQIMRFCEASSSVFCGIPLVSNAEMDKWPCFFTFFLPYNNYSYHLLRVYYVVGGCDT